MSAGGDPADLLGEHGDVFTWENVWPAISDALEMKPGNPVPLLRSRRWLAVVGSVGQPRDRNPAAGYAIYDSQANELTFRHVGLFSQRDQDARAHSRRLAR